MARFDESMKDKIRDIYNEESRNYLAAFTKGFLKVNQELVHDAIVKELTQCSHKKVLDAGGGPGQLGMIALDYGCDVTVVDISNEMLNVGRSIAEKKGVGGCVKFIEGDLESLTFLEDRSYDFIICEGSVISFLPHPEQAIKEMYRVLEPGGVLMLTAQNRLFFMWEGRALPTVMSVFKSGRVFPHINPGAYGKCTTYSFLPQELQDMVTNVGFDILKYSTRMISTRYIGDIDAQLENNPMYYDVLLDIERTLEEVPEFRFSGRILNMLLKKLK